MRWLLCCLNLCYILTTTTSAQQYFPVKVNQRWGLIDKAGKTVVEPTYDAIGEFYKYGYAVIQKNGKVGIINDKGRIILPTKYYDLQILDSVVFGVVIDNRWKIIDAQEKVILDDYYERVKILQKEYISFSRKGKWGLVHLTGREIVQPIYDNISVYQNDYFLIENGIYKGLLRPNGKIIISPIAEEIQIHSDSLFFYKRHYKWGAVDYHGKNLLNADWNTYELIGNRFIKLAKEGKNVLYSRAFRRIISNTVYDDYLVLSQTSILVKFNHQLGVMNEFGKLILKCQYDEIKLFDNQQYRVRKLDKWGVIDEDENEILSFKYSYISPLKKDVCIIRENKLLGIANQQGEIIIQPEYSKIELKNNRAKAFKGTKLTLFNFNSNGELMDNSSIGTFSGTIKIKKKSGASETLNVLPLGSANSDEDYILENFEWFYSPLEDRWGLRSLTTGDIVIKPMFDKVVVKKDLGFSIVSMKRFHKQVIDRTTFRFDELYGMVNNEQGKLVTEMYFWDIRLEDFEQKNLPVARCIFKNGKHGLVQRNGKIIKENCAYIGEYQNGIARVSSVGYLSGTTKNVSTHLGKVSDFVKSYRSPSEMSDYTLHDEDFQKNAVLTCENCVWGFIDTTGKEVVPYAYSFANDFSNGIAIVQKEDKWGFIDKKNKVLLDFKYDDVEFLGNTNRQILRLYINQNKWGLIDTLGNAAIPVIYENIGEASEGLVPVKKNGLWGYTNQQGKLVIPCQYEAAQGFHSGLAAVRKNRKWGFINRYNNIIIPLKYKTVGKFKEELAWFREAYKYGYINPEGKVIIEAQFDKTEHFENGIARVKTEEGWGIIDRNGLFILRPKYEYISNFNKYGLAVVKIGTNKFSFINRQGIRVTSKRFRKVTPYREGYAGVQHNDTWGFVDSSGRIVIAPAYKRIGSFHSGRAAAKDGNKWGFIDTKGNWVIKAQFSKCLNFKDGKAVVYKGYKNAGLIDLNGNYIIEPSIFRMIDFSEGRGLVRDGNYRFYYITEDNRVYKGYYQNAEGFQDGVAAVQKRGKWGLINDKGIELIPPKYDKVEAFDNGFAKVRITQFSGVVNVEGEIIADANYEYITYAGNGIFRVEEGDKIGYFDSSGKWIWELQR